MTITSIHLPEEDKKKLAEISASMRRSRSGAIQILIRQAHLKLVKEKKVPATSDTQR